MNLTGSVQCLTSKDRMNSQNVLILAKPNSGASVSFTKILPETINFKPQENVAHKLSFKCTVIIALKTFHTGN